MTEGAKLEKAYLTVLEPSPSGGSGEIARLDLQFNPKEYSVQKSASWESKPAKGAKKASMPEFKGAEPRSMTVEVFLDRTDSDSADVTGDIETLFRCCTPVEKTVGKNKPSPPFVQFVWGKTTSFTAFVKQVSVKYTLFRPDGSPVRATASLTLQEIPREPGNQNPTSGSLTARRTHLLVDGESLQSVAYREYGDPTQWRVVAEANGIDDPFRVAVGTSLLVPPPDEALARA